MMWVEHIVIIMDGHTRHQTAMKKVLTEKWRIETQEQSATREMNWMSRLQSILVVHIVIGRVHIGLRTYGYCTRLIDRTRTRLTVLMTLTWPETQTHLYIFSFWLWSLCYHCLSARNFQTTFFISVYSHFLLQANGLPKPVLRHGRRHKASMDQLVRLFAVKRSTCQTDSLKR